LAGVDDPTAEKILKRATNDANRAIRATARQMLGLRDGILRDKRKAYPLPL
jgi:DNA-binding protein Fis